MVFASKLWVILLGKRWHISFCWRKGQVVSFTVFGQPPVLKWNIPPTSLVYRSVYCTLYIWIIKLICLTLIGCLEHLDAWCFYKWVSSIQTVPWIWMMSSHHQGWCIHLDTQSMVIINHLNGGSTGSRFSTGANKRRNFRNCLRWTKNHKHLPDRKRIISIIPKNKHIHVREKNNKNCLLPQGWIERGWASYGRSFRRAKATSKADIPAMSNTGVCHMSAFNGT